MLTCLYVDLHQPSVHNNNKLAPDKRPILIYLNLTILGYKAWGITCTLLYEINTIHEININFKNLHYFKLHLFFWMLISTQLIEWSVISATLISTILAPNFRPLLTFLTPKKEGYLIRWRSTSNSETAVKNPQSAKISSLDPLWTFRESTMNKVSILDCALNLVPVVF